MDPDRPSSGTIAEKLERANRWYFQNIGYLSSATKPAQNRQANPGCGIWWGTRPRARDETVSLPVGDTSGDRVNWLLLPVRGPIFRGHGPRSMEAQKVFGSSRSGHPDLEGYWSLHLQAEF